MQNEAQKQEMIKVKLRELAELEAQMPKEPELNLYEQDETAAQDAQYQEQPQQPDQKYYDVEQVLVAMWAETITATLLEVPMSEFKRSRLMMVRDKLLYEMDLSEFVPQAQVPQQEPEQEPMPRSHDDEIGSVVDGIVEPKFSEANRDLDTISQKLKDIDGKDGLMAPEEIEEEPTGLKKLLGMGGGKKKVIERSVDEKHQPSSMG